MRIPNPSGTVPLDRARIVALGARGLQFNGNPLQLDDDVSRSDERLAFYGSARAFRESFRANEDWRAFFGAAVNIGGKAVLIAGASGVGKTTLALALLDRGARLYGDEHVLVRRKDKMVAAFPRTMMIREPGLAQIENPRIAALCRDDEAGRSSQGWRYWNFVDPLEAYGDDVVAPPATLSGIVVLDPASERVDAAALAKIHPAAAAGDLSKRLHRDEAGLARLADILELCAGLRAYRMVAGHASRGAELLMRAFAA
ncbi:MAG: hypothetical protein GIW95_02490 [Candidatus Eremiobacteraeota bacterium]|nr:hypothetical protein [Candidatus Eremiobacteraeota bacterium]